MYWATLTGWLDYLIILGKEDLFKLRHSLWSLRCKFLRVVFCDFVRFHQPKNHSYPANTIQGAFSMVGLVIVLLWLTDCTDLSKCVITANTYLKWNCDEPSAVHKVTFFNESFILFFNSLQMSLVQENPAIRNRSLDLLITAMGIFTKSLCLTSR